MKKKLVKIKYTRVGHGNRFTTCCLLIHPLLPPILLTYTCTFFEHEKKKKKKIGRQILNKDRIRLLPSFSIKMK